MLTIVCPLCRKVVEVPEDFPPRPFCSARCKLADLDNWLEERYRFSSPLSDQEDASGAAEAADRDGDDQRRNQH